MQCHRNILARIQSNWTLTDGVDSLISSFPAQNVANCRLKTTVVRRMLIDHGFVLLQVRDRQGLKVNGVAPPDEPLESFKPSRSLKDLGCVKKVELSLFLAYRCTLL